MRTYQARQIADYFLTKADPDIGDIISNLKLQKLCYYAQGVGIIARAGTPLFPEKIEAWLHGPVVPELYQAFRNHKGEAIPAPKEFSLDIFAKADRSILDDVYDFYGQYSAWRLRQLTHEEAPWKDAYEQGQGTTITLEAIKNFFADEVKPEYSARYEQLLKAQR